VFGGGCGHLAGEAEEVARLRSEPLAGWSWKAVPEPRKAHSRAGKVIHRKHGTPKCTSFVRAAFDALFDGENDVVRVTGVNERGFPSGVGLLHEIVDSIW